jgi:hypothetical protein
MRLRVRSELLRGASVVGRKDIAGTGVSSNHRSKSTGSSRSSQSAVLSGALLLGEDPQPARHQVTELPPVKPEVIE